MPAAEPFYPLLPHPKPIKLSREENIILETELFSRICDELCAQGVSSMIEEDMMRGLISDILHSNEYTLEGIAYYADIPEDVICDIMMGRNSSASFRVCRKLINLHRMVRPNLYREIIKKVVSNVETNV